MWSIWTFDSGHKYEATSSRIPPATSQRWWWWWWNQGGSHISAVKQGLEKVRGVWLLRQTNPSSHSSISKLGRSQFNLIYTITTQLMNPWSRNEWRSNSSPRKWRFSLDSGTSRWNARNLSLKSIPCPCGVKTSCHEVLQITYYVKISWILTNQFTSNQ